MSEKRPNANIKRRIVKRHNAIVSVYLSTSKGPSKCKTKNISRGGTFIETTFRDFQVGDDIEVIFNQQDENSNVHRIRRYLVRIVHKDFNGYGMKFLTPNKR